MRPPAPPPSGVGAALAVHLGMAAYVASAALGVWVAADPAAAVRHAQTVALGGAVYVLAWLLVRSRSGRAVALAGCLVAGALAGGYFLTQYRYLASPEAKVAGLDVLGRALSSPFPRVGSWSPFPNSLATLLEGLVALALGLWLARGPAAMRALAAAAGIVVTLAVAISASRGAWLAVAVSLAAFAAHRHLVRWSAAIGLGAVVVLGAVVGGTVSGGDPWWIHWLDAAGRQDRLDVYLQAASLLREVPFTGLGGGDQFAAAVSRYVLLIQVPFITYAHNFSLQVWLEDGLLGLAAWWGLAAAVALAAVAGERAGLGRRFRGIWAGLLAIHLHGLTDARQFVDPWTWTPVFVLTGALAGFVSRPLCRLPPRATWAPAAVALVVVVAAISGRGAPRAAWETNRGALAQARADAEIAAATGDGAGWRAAAAARFDRALALAPRDAPSLRRAGILALDQGRDADARRWLGAAWTAEPGHAPTRKAYGLAAVWSGDTALAADLLGPVPGMADELATWSRYRQERGDTRQAIAAARTALALEPDQPELQAWLHQLERVATPPAAPR